MAIKIDPTKPINARVPAWALGALTLVTGGYMVAQEMEDYVRRGMLREELMRVELVCKQHSLANRVANERRIDLLDHRLSYVERSVEKKLSILKEKLPYE